MREARQVSTIQRLLVGYLFVIALLGGGFAVGSALLVRAADRDRAIALIETDVAETLDKIGRDPASQRARAFAIVLARSAIEDERLYRLTEDGRVVAGLPDTVTLRREGRFYESSAPAGLARRIRIDADTDLWIGRRLVQGALTRRLLTIGAIVLGIALAIAGIVGFLATRELRARVAAINAACDRVRGGDFAARAPAGTRDDEFSALARHVNEMLERIDSLVAGLRDVSNRIAHDLRTPVSRLRNSIDQAAAAPDLAEARSLAAAASAETDDILQTFEALLDIAEVEAGSTGGLAPMRLDEAVAAAVELYASVADARPIRLSTRLDRVTILGEKMLVIRLAANLIDNAIKFSPPGSIVEVAVMDDAGAARLVVRDSGPGIPDEERDIVLGRYQRGKTVRHVAGHGLGLALVTAVAKRHGARVDLEGADPGLAVSVRFNRFEG